MASIVAISFMAGFATGVARLTISPLLSAARFGFLAMAYAAVYTTAEGLFSDVTPGIATGAVIGVAGGVLLGVALVVGFGVRGGLVSGLVVGAAASVTLGAAGSIAWGVAFGVAFAVAFLRLPLWLAEASVTRWLVWRIGHRPGSARRFSRWLPFRNHDLIYLPLPGLRAGLIQIAEIDPELGRELIARAADSIAQGRAARLALVELQARDLEHAARDRLFARAAGLDLPHLPKDVDLASEPANAPILSFQTAARDLIAGSANHRHRRLALERARATLESSRLATAGAIDPPPLARRL
ncbi:MAG TPA: hypothetical protein VF469_38025, partial [Kofleriaceae bacterium]